MFFVDAKGKVQRIIGADSEPQLATRVKQEAAANPDWYPVSESQIHLYSGARHRLTHEMDNFQSLMRQTGPATGVTAASVLERGPAEMRAVYETQLRQMADIDREVRRIYFNSELDYLRLQKNASGVDVKKRTVFDDLAAAILGNPNLDANSGLGQAYGKIEDIYDVNMMNAAAKVYRTAIPMDNPLAQRAARHRFEQMERDLAPEHRPWKTLDDYLAKTVTTPGVHTLRRHGAMLNSQTTLWSLRFMELGLAYINIGSLASTIPVITEALRPLADEVAGSVAHHTRIGVFSNITPKGNYKFSWTKVMADAFHGRFTPEGRKVVKDMADRGLLEQHAAEQNEIWGHGGSFTQTKWDRFTAMMSKPVDVTEREARIMTSYGFYNIARKGMGLDHEASMVFAFDNANRVIADFRPSNRPQIFQGAVGMPLGLFTTYMWNYLQRIVSVIETKSVRTGALQVGLQASLFGAETLPGWSEYTNLFMDNYDGSHSIVDRLNESMGSVGADVFLNGTVSNLPRLLGMDDGISIGPRANVGVPFAQGLSATNVAGVRMITRAAQTIGSAWDAALADHEIDPVHQAEILSASGLNKGLANLIELAVGHAVDYQGNIIEQDTRTTVGVASRLLGLKPLMADEMRQENYRNRTTDAIRDGLKERLALTLKSKIRNGRLKEQDVEEALTDYVQAGGNAESFRRFFQSQIVRGVVSKRDREIKDALQNSMDKNRVARLIYLSRD